MDELIKQYADRIVIDLEGDLDGVDFYEYLKEFAEEIEKEVKTDIFGAINHNLVTMIHHMGRIANILDAVTFSSIDGMTYLMTDTRCSGGIEVIEGEEK